MKNKVFLILYYLVSLIIIPLYIIYSVYYIDMYNNGNNSIGLLSIDCYPFTVLLIMLSLIVCIITTILIIKNKNINITNKDYVLIISYILFIIIIVTCCFIFDKRLIVPGIEYYYYLNILLIAYILLNIDIYLSINKKKKNNRNIKKIEKSVKD
ncbi:MAG: hypothetical protein VZS44_03925 [Bacilli bacterium]|nr:hypothetical protein [Bacilli bacterium]